MNSEQKIEVSYKQTEWNKNHGRDAEGHMRMCFDSPQTSRILEVSQAVPNGVICLISALEIYGIVRKPNENIWVAIANKARKPSKTPAGTRVVRFSDQTLEAGRKVLLIPGGGEIHVHSPAKAIVDCFKYRRKLAEGPNYQLDDLLDILQSSTSAYKQKMLVSVSAVKTYLEVCRMLNVMGPYIDVLEKRELSRTKKNS